MYKYIAAFGFGAVIGAIGTMLWLRKEFNKKVEETSLEQQRKLNHQYHEDSQNDVKKEPENNTEKNLQKTYEKLNRELIKRHGYSGDDAESSVREDTQEQKKTPYGISDDDFLLTNREYDKITLVFYDDGVLSTEDGTVVEDVVYILGPKWMSQVGKYEEDVAYIRNDTVGSDYEIIIQHRNYADEYGPNVD